MRKWRGVFGQTKRSICKVLRIKYPALAALLGFSSIIGSCGSDNYVLDIDKIILRNTLGERIFSIRELTSLPIYKICSFGPYDEVSFVTDPADRKALEDIDIFPINEGDGYFIYFDNIGGFLGHDRFQVNTGAIRWSRDGTNYCISSPHMAVKSSRDGDTIVISLVER